MATQAQDSYAQAMISYCELEEENERLVARVKELEDFVVAEGECHISNDELRRLEGAIKAAIQTLNSPLPNVARKAKNAEKILAGAIMRFERVQPEREQK